MAKNPVFPLYYNDIDRTTKDWTDEEYGAYVRLLVHQWDMFGLPLGFDRLNRIAPSAEKNWHLLSKKFRDVDGKLQNARLEEIRAEQLIFKNKQKENGKKGGRPRKSKKPKNNPDDNPNTNPTHNPKKTLHYEDEEEYELEDVFKKDRGMGKGNPSQQNSPQQFKGLVPNMRDVWLEIFPDYTFMQDVDFPALQEISKFIFKAASIPLGKIDPGDNETCLNTFRVIAREIEKDEFWFKQSLTTISKPSTLQKFYTQIKNPHKNGKAKPATGGDINLRSTFDKIDQLTGQTGGSR